MCDRWNDNGVKKFIFINTIKPFIFWKKTKSEKPKK